MSLVNETLTFEFSFFIQPTRSRKNDFVRIHFDHSNEIYFNNEMVKLNFKQVEDVNHLWYI